MSINEFKIVDYMYRGECMCILKIYEKHTYLSSLPPKSIHYGNKTLRLILSVVRYVKVIFMEEIFNSIKFVLPKSHDLSKTHH